MIAEQWYELIRGKTTLSSEAFFEIHRQASFTAAGDVLTDKPHFARRLGLAMWKAQQLLAALAFFDFADLPCPEYAEALVVAASAISGTVNSLQPRPVSTAPGKCSKLYGKSCPLRLRPNSPPSGSIRRST